LSSIVKSTQAGIMFVGEEEITRPEEVTLCLRRACVRTTAS